MILSGLCYAFFDCWICMNFKNVVIMIGYIFLIDNIIMENQSNYKVLPVYLECFIAYYSHCCFHKSI